MDRKPNTRIPLQAPRSRNSRTTKKQIKKGSEKIMSKMIDKRLSKIKWFCANCHYQIDANFIVDTENEIRKRRLKKRKKAMK